MTMPSKSHRLIIASLLLVSLAASAALAGPTSLAKAKSLVKQEQYVEAQEMLKGLLADDPDNTELLLWLGRAAIGSEDYGVAEEALSAVTAMAPKSTEGRYWLGVALERAGRLGDALTAYRTTLRLDRGHKLAAEGAKRVSPALPVDDPSRHHAVALEVEGGLSVDRAKAQVESPRIHDYTFSRAPSDWIMALGDWRVRSRWSCTPDWNFMGGESPQVAAIWNKREFMGDITVEAYMSFKMNVMGEGGYRKPSDLNMSICADGRNLFSGYSFIVGGWGNSWTRIMKGTEVLAETNNPAYKPTTLLDDSGGGTWQWHRRWWEIRAIKRGEYLYLFYDNELILQAHDPDPIPGGRVAMWTFDNGIMIPRVKIYHEDERPAGERSQPPYAPVISPTNQPDLVPALTFTSGTHPAAENRFDHDLGGWTRRDGQHGAQLMLDSLTADGEGQCLRLINEHSGGTFGATVTAGPLEATNLTRLAFDYRAPDTLKANLQLTASGQRYEIIFTAPDLPSDGAIRLAAIPEVQTDLQWHHVDLDLLGCLRKFHPDAEAIEITDVWLGLDTARDYALSGFNANPAVCEYRLDNFAIYSPGTDVGLFNVAVTPDEDGAVPEVTYDYDLSDSPTPELEGVTRSTDGTIAFAQVAEGLHYLHAQALGADGAPATPVYTRAVVVDSSPPTVAAITPEPDSKVSGEEFIIALSDVASAIDATTLGVTVNDIGIPADHPAVQLNPLTNHVTVRPALADITFDPDTEIKLALAGCADTLGHAIPEPQVWSYKYDRESDDVAPVAPVIQPPRGPLCVDTFEDGLGEWTPYSTTIAAALSIDDSTAASGTRSLRVYNPKSAGSMGAVVRAEPFDAGVYRYISFDYKLRPEVRIDLYAVVNGDGYSVALSNSDGTNSLGSFENVGLDDQWHHAECDLYSLLKAVAPTAPGYIVTSLILMDAGSYGNIQHQHYNIDNFVIAPVFSATSGAEIGIDADDPSGIAGVSYAFDGARDTVPPAESATSGLIAMLPDLPGGLGWLHARLADGAGNWGEPTHRFLGVDGQAPTAAAGAPAAGAVAATSTVSLSITDAGIAGVDPRSIHLDVGGTVYYVDNAGLTYNGDSGALTWNCEQTTGAPVVFADGQAIEAKLVAAADYAGNPAPELPTWGWTMDYKQDTSAPSIASLAAGTHASYLAHRFEGSTHAVQKYGSDSTATVEVEEGVTPDGTGSSVKIINATAGGNMAAYLYASAYASNSYPYLAFDYMIPAGVTVDLGVYFYNEILWFQMNGNAGGYTATVPNIVADGNWHTCIFNLYEQLAARATAQGLGAYYKATYVILQHRDTAALTAGTAINIDNLFIGASGANAATLSWSATDTTGIAGYSYAIDNAPNTDPPTTPIDAAVTGQFADRPVGMNWFHVRAVDGAGNWGPTSHQAILVQ